MRSRRDSCMAAPFVNRSRNAERPPAPRPVLAILRQDPQRILAVDPGQLRGAEPRLLELLDMVDDGAVGVIRAEHDLRRADETLQRTQLQKAGRLRRVVVEAPQMIQ